MTDDNRTLAEWAAADSQDAPAAPKPEPGIEEPVAAVGPEPGAATEPEPPAVESAPAEAEPAAEPPAAEEGQKAKKPTPLPKWMKDRLAEQTAKQHDADRRAAEQQARADAAEAALEAIRRKAAAGETVTAQAPAPLAPKPPDGFVPATEVDARARQIAAEQAFNARADASYHEGKKAYPDFDDAVGTLAAMNAVQRRDFQEAALATGAAHDVIYHLGSNPEEAQAILADLAAGASVNATAKMTKIAMRVAGEKSATAKLVNKVSGAPAPIKPIGGSAVPVVDLDKMSDDDFTAEFDKKARANGWY